MTLVDLQPTAPVKSAASTAVLSNASAMPFRLFAGLSSASPSSASSLSSAPPFAQRPQIPPSAASLALDRYELGVSNSALAF